VNSRSFFSELKRSNVRNFLAGESIKTAANVLSVKRVSNEGAVAMRQRSEIRSQRPDLSERQKVGSRRVKSIEVGETIPASIRSNNKSLEIRHLPLQR
jgi:hypothetical protein